MNTSKGIVKYLFAILVLILVGLYYQSEIFRFSEVPSSAEATYYNPYKKWNKRKVLKANFHSHGKAWGGITNGHNSEEEIIKEYQKLGFSVSAVSNYHQISNTRASGSIFIPCYEQGFNLSKTHLLAIDATGSNHLDFPIGQGLSQKQTRISNVKKKAALVALTHPGLGGGYTTQDLRYLKGYDLMEVLSPYFESFELWDYALSKGNLSWILANDDTHDLEKQPPGRFFNMISAQSKTKNGVIGALKTGNHLAYASDKGVVDVFLEKIDVHGNTIRYSFSGNINRVKLIKNGAAFIIDPKGVVVLDQHDKYARFEVVGQRSVLYTNPIYKLGLSHLAQYSAIPYTVDIFKTVSYRLAVLSVGFIALLFLFQNRAIPFLKLAFLRVPSILKNRRIKRLSKKMQL